MSPTLLQAVVRVAEGRTADADLLARFARDRDEAAFEELVRRHGALVWGVCRQLLPHHADAEDAFQAVFLALVRGAGGVRSGQALAAWLHGVAVRVATRVKRTAARRKQREQRVALAEADRPVPDAAWAALLAAVHEEVRRLPEAERVAFVLCELEGVRQPDAAERLGWPLGTLSGRLCKARQRLIELLSRRGIAPGVLALGGVGASGGSVPAALVNRVNSFPSATAGGVPSTVAELARGLAGGVAMRTKLMAAAVLVAGALGITGGAVVLSRADAQTGGGSGGGGGAPPGVGLPQPGGPGLPPGAQPGAPGATTPGTGTGLRPGSQPPGGPGFPGSGGGAAMSMPGMGTGTGMAGPGHRPWEYKFVEPRSQARDEFEQTLTQQGKEGWEYAGSELLAATGRPAGGSPAGVTQRVLVFKRLRGGGGVAMGGMMPGMMGGGMGGPGMGEGGSGFGGGGGAIGPGMPGGGGLGPVGPGDEGPGMRKNVFEVVKLRTARAEDVVTALTKAFPAAKLRAVAEKGSNSVIIIDVDGAVLKDVRKKIADLDSSPDPLPHLGADSGMSSAGGTGGFGVPGGGSSGPAPGGMGMGGLMSGFGSPAPAGEIKVLVLKHATAEETGAVLERVFVGKANVTPVPRTNQLVVQADPETLNAMAALLKELDVAVTKRP